MDQRTYHHGNLKAELVSGSLELLAESGLAGFSVAKLAKRLGVSPAAPYRHFADRDELLAAVAIEVGSGLAAAMADAAATGPQDPANRLARAIGAYTRYALDHGVGLELVFDPVFRQAKFQALHEHSRRLMDVFLPLAHEASIDPEWNASLVLMESQLALAQGFASLQTRGAFQLVDLSDDEVVAHATAASLTVIHGARAQYTEHHPEN